MRLGVFHLMSTPPWSNVHDVIDQHMDQAVEADRLGYDTCWVTEHNVRDYAMGGSVTVTLSALARVTKRIRLGTAVVRLPLHHPLHLAEDLAFVDNLCGGRLEFGIGKGYDELEFNVYGVPYEERVERWEETYQAVTQMWESGRTEFKGEFFDIPDAKLYPGPMQKPSIPVYVMVIKSFESIKWAAERLYPFVLGQALDWNGARERLEYYGEMARDAGHDDESIREAMGRCWQLKQVHVAETTQIAQQQYKEPFQWFFKALANRAMYGFPLGDQPYDYFLKNKNVLLGSPDRVVEDLLAYREFTGIQNVIGWFNCGGQPHQQVLNSMRGFSEEVMPHLKNPESDLIPDVVDPSLAAHGFEPDEDKQLEGVQ